MPSAPSITAVVPSKSTLGAIHIYGFYECPKPRNLSARRDACDGGPLGATTKGEKIIQPLGEKPISIRRRYLIELRRREEFRPLHCLRRCLIGCVNANVTFLATLSASSSRPVHPERAEIEEGDRISSNVASDFTSR